MVPNSTVQDRSSGCSKPGMWHSYVAIIRHDSGTYVRRGGLMDSIHSVLNPHLNSLVAQIHKRIHKKIDILQLQSISEFMSSTFCTSLPNYVELEGRKIDMLMSYQHTCTLPKTLAFTSAFSLCSGSACSSVYQYLLMWCIKYMRDSQPVCPCSRWMDTDVPNVLWCFCA